jgi:hypothetical protein
MTNDECSSLALQFVIRHSTFVTRHLPWSVHVCCLKIQFTRRTDGTALLRCVRDDGSEAWQKQQGAHAAFFPLHDLTHYAVETQLGFSRGFYGLIADGWEIAETTGKEGRGPLPDEAIEVEYIVSVLGAERTGDTRSTAQEFNHLALTFATMKGWPEPRPLTDAELGRVRSRMAELFARWNALPPGGTLELTFP